MRPGQREGRQLSRQRLDFHRCGGLSRRRQNYVLVGEIELPDLKDVGAREPASEPIRQISCELINELRAIACFAASPLLLIDDPSPPFASTPSSLWSSRLSGRSSCTVEEFNNTVVQRLVPAGVSGDGSLGMRFQRT